MKNEILLSSLNTATIIVTVIVAVVVIATIVFTIISRRKGKSCNCSCYSADCPQKKKNK